MEDNYITILPGIKGGYIIMKMVYNKPMDMYSASAVDCTVYKDKAEAAAKAWTIAQERKLEVRL